VNCAQHPERPAIAPCDRCGTFVCAECRTAVGSQGLCRACVERSRLLEWDQRRELGMFRAWWLTTKRLILSPIQTFDVIAPEGNLFDSILYASISSLVGILPTLLFYALVLGGALLFGTLNKDGGSSDFTPAVGVGIGAAAVLVYLVLAVLMAIAFVLVTAALELLVLRMLGGRQGDYPTLVRCHALSTASYAIGVVPICSLYIYPIWALVLRIFAVQRLARTTTGIAVGAVLIPIGLCCTLCGGGYFAMIMLSMGLRK
jgi:hypothetical protein